MASVSGAGHWCCNLSLWGYGTQCSLPPNGKEAAYRPGCSGQPSHNHEVNILRMKPTHRRRQSMEHRRETEPECFSNWARSPPYLRTCLFPAGSPTQFALDNVLARGKMSKPIFEILINKNLQESKLWFPAFYLMQIHRCTESQLFF